MASCRGVANPAVRLIRGKHDSHDNMIRGKYCVAPKTPIYLAGSFPLTRLEACSMKTKIIVAGAGIVFAAALFYFARNSKQPPVQQTQGLIRPDARTVNIVCVERIQNLSHQVVDMEGVDDELVAQLQKRGFQSLKVSNIVGKCEATVNRELMELSARGRKTLR